MPRIILAYWHAGHGPGDEVDVTSEELAALVRDGRVAEVVVAKAEPQTSETEPPAAPEADAVDEPGARAGRRRK